MGILGGKKLNNPGSVTIELDTSKKMLTQVSLRSPHKVRLLKNKLSLPRIKALKTLVWHLSREPMKEMSSLKNKQTVMHEEQDQTNKAKD